MIDLMTDSATTGPRAYQALYGMRIVNVSSKSIHWLDNSFSLSQVCDVVIVSLVDCFSFSLFLSLFSLLAAAGTLPAQFIAGEMALWVAHPLRSTRPPHTLRKRQNHLFILLRPGTPTALFSTSFFTIIVTVFDHFFKPIFIILYHRYPSLSIYLKKKQPFKLFISV